MRTRIETLRVRLARRFMETLWLVVRRGGAATVDFQLAGPEADPVQVRCGDRDALGWLKGVEPSTFSLVS